MAKPDREKKKRLTISVDPEVYQKIKKHSKNSSTFINDVLKRALFSDIEYYKMNLKEAQMSVNHWDYLLTQEQLKMEKRTMLNGT